MNWGDWGGDWPHGAWGFMMLSWVIIVGLAVWSLTRLFPRGKSRTSAMELLDARRARGEISAEERRKIRAELSKSEKRDRNRNWRDKVESLARKERFDPGSAEDRFPGKNRGLS